MKILVTGAGGFLGFHILKLFEKQKKNYQLFAQYNKKKPFGLKKTTKLIKTDLTKINFTDHYDLIIHCASKTPVNSQNDKIIYYENINSLKTILKKISFDKFVFMSSVSVYGSHRGIVLNERTKFKPNDSYAKSKIKCEKLLEVFSKKKRKKIFVFRLPAAVGYKSHSNFISNIMKAYKENINNLISVSNKEDLFNNTVHTKEIFNFIKIVVNRKTRFFYNVFVLGAKDAISLKNLISIYDKFFKKKIKFNFIENKNKNNLINISKAIRFGFKPIRTSSTILNMLKDNS